MANGDTNEKVFDLMAAVDDEIAVGLFPFEDEDLGAPPMTTSVAHIPRWHTMSPAQEQNITPSILSASGHFLTTEESLTNVLDMIDADEHTKQIIREVWEESGQPYIKAPGAGGAESDLPFSALVRSDRSEYWLDGGLPVDTIALWNDDISLLSNLASEFPHTFRQKLSPQEEEIEGEGRYGHPSRSYEREKIRSDWKKFGGSRYGDLRAIEAMTHTLAQSYLLRNLSYYLQSKDAQDLSEEEEYAISGIRHGEETLKKTTEFPQLELGIDVMYHPQMQEVIQWAVGYGKSFKDAFKYARELELDSFMWKDEKGVIREYTTELE